MKMFMVSAMAMTFVLGFGFSAIFFVMTQMMLQRSKQSYAIN
jgi:hypothetical protein